MVVHGDQFWFLRRMRQIFIALMCATTVLASGCARSIGGFGGLGGGSGSGAVPGAGGVMVNQSSADAALAQLFSDSGEAVLRVGDPALNSGSLPGSAMQNQQRVRVQTPDGVYLMTPIQFAQYSAIQRAAQNQLAGGLRPNGAATMLAGATNATLQGPANAAVEMATAATASVGTGTAPVPNGFEPYIAPGLTLTKGPKGFNNADGSFDCVLTFDDGPHHSRDPMIYDILDQKGVKAVFFFLGEKVQANPNTAKTAALRGHEVGYHSWDHKNLRAETLATVQEDFRKGLEVFKAIGLNPRYYRPPFGNYNSGLLETARNNGMDVINWSNDSLDWKPGSASEITSRVLNRNIPGDIILLHSIHARSVEALPGVIDGLRAKGCRFTTLQSWISRATS